MKEEKEKEKETVNDGSGVMVEKEEKEREVVEKEEDNLKTRPIEVWALMTSLTPSQPVVC